MAELSPYDKKAVDACKEKMASFKANFEDLQKFVKEVIIANFDEFELSVPHAHSSQPQLFPLQSFLAISFFPLTPVDDNSHRSADYTASSHINRISEEAVCEARL